MDDAIYKAVTTMFTDKRLISNGHYSWKANIDGTRLGVVASTKGPGFVNFALGKGGYDRVVTAKQTNKIDVALVVFADADDVSRFTFLNAFDAVELQPRLEALPLRVGKFGPFWVLSHSWAHGDFDEGEAW